MKRGSLKIRHLENQTYVFFFSYYMHLVMHEVEEMGQDSET